MLKGDGANYTYLKTDATGPNNAPVIFSAKGDPRADCGSPDIGDHEGICGVTIPIKNYKLDCIIK